MQGGERNEWAVGNLTNLDQENGSMSEYGLLRWHISWVMRRVGGCVLTCV